LNKQGKLKRNPQVVIALRTQERVLQILKRKKEEGEEEKEGMKKRKGLQGGEGEVIVESMKRGARAHLKERRDRLTE